MQLAKGKLKNQLALINALSKAIIIVLAIFVIPKLVRTISIRETDDQLIQKLDQVYDLIENNGIEVFIDNESNSQGFGSYNILKEEYISIEETTDSLLYEYIDNQQREIDEEIYEYRVISATFSIEDQVYLLEIGKSINTVISFEKKLKSFAFYLLLFLLTISIFIDLSITQILLKPFEKIIIKLKKTAHPKQFDHKMIPTSTSDFNYLQTSIGDLMHQIESTFEAEREFISNVSHELLTPITIIRTKLDNFTSNSDLSGEELRKIFEAKSTLSRLTKMVRSLLLLSRIENKEYLKEDQVNLLDLLSEVQSEFQDRADIKEQSLIIDTTGNKFGFTGNKELLRILLSNLVSNAIKYTPKKGNIKLGLTSNSKEIILEISDNGLGISKPDLSTIFNRFKKIGNHKESFGLGLALVKQIADYHFIDIQVESELDKSTSFFLTFKIKD